MPFIQVKNYPNTFTISYSANGKVGTIYRAADGRYYASVTVGDKTHLSRGYLLLMNAKRFCMLSGKELGDMEGYY